MLISHSGGEGNSLRQSLRCNFLSEELCETPWRREEFLTGENGGATRYPIRFSFEGIVSLPLQAERNRDLEIATCRASYRKSPFPLQTEGNRDLEIATCAASYRKSPFPLQTWFLNHGSFRSSVASCFRDIPNG
jgi:hypothetical protein